ncbi:MAG: hypothetical protein P8179_03125 [Candidatus Thiodiazotropha sp.]|jgi:hypothetical protein
MKIIYCLLFIFSSHSFADVFRCIDNNGNAIFTDNKQNCINAKNTETKRLESELPSRNSFYNEIPDLLQTKKSANFAGGGKQFCGPVAVSNSLVWLENVQDESHQIELVHKLSSSEYMNTSAENGTGTGGLIRGIDKYVTEVFGRYRKLEYSGWKKCPNKYHSIIKIPTLSFMRSGLNRKGAVWLNIGFYKADKIKNEYLRVGGHWVTLVGFEGGQLIIHDPASRAGKSFHNDFIDYSILASGILISKKIGKQRLAKGFFRLGSGLSIPKRADTAVIDGVVVLQI